MKFNSQVCTNKEQSERLLALGLKKETADMHYYHTVDFEGNEVWFPSIIPYENVVMAFDFVGETEICLENNTIPAWSLHRLIEMMSNTLQDLYELDFSKLGVYYADFSNGSYNFIQSFAKPNTILYDNVINCIEWLIKECYFNKEYLEQ